MRNVIATAALALLALASSVSIPSCSKVSVMPFKYLCGLSGAPLAFPYCLCLPALC